jgi:hypothetical protein
MKNLNWVQTIDLNLLTCGSDDLTYEENINILKHVFNFIKSSERFLVAQLFDKNLLSNLASIQHNLLINSLIVYNIFLYVLCYMHAQNDHYTRDVFLKSLK